MFLGVGTSWYLSHISSDVMLNLDWLEKAMATHSSTLVWKIPWTEETARLQSMGLQRVGHLLSDFTFTFHFHALEKEMATRSSVLALRIPGTEEPGGLPSMGLHRVGHDWSDLAAAAAVPSLQGKISISKTSSSSIQSPSQLNKATSHSINAYPGNHLVYQSFLFLRK